MLFDKKSYTGKVISIADEAEETATDIGRETTIEVDVKVENPDEENQTRIYRKVCNNYCI